MKTEEKIKPVKSNKKVKTKEKGVKEEKKRVFKHLDLDLENISPYTRGPLAE